MRRPYTDVAACAVALAVLGPLLPFLPPRGRAAGHEQYVRLLTLTAELMWCCAVLLGAVCLLGVRKQPPPRQPSCGAAHDRTGRRPRLGPSALAGTDGDGPSWAGRSGARREVRHRHGCGSRDVVLADGHVVVGRFHPGAQGTERHPAAYSWAKGGAGRKVTGRRLPCGAVHRRSGRGGTSGDG